MALGVPVLLITWQRPDTTREVLQHLSKVQPSTLIVASDGPRHAGQMERIEQTRDLFDDLPWECEVIRVYSDFNMGLAWRVTSAIDFAFEHYEQLIILEDDVIANESFFSYCENLLDYYHNHEQVMMIRGTSHSCIPQHEPSASYVFTRFMSPWGWATWKRGWEGFDHSFFASKKARFLNRHPRLNNMRALLRYIPYWPKFNHDPELRKRLSSCGERYTFWLESCDRELKTRSWAGRYANWLLEQDGLVATPRVNMTHNIGFRTDAVHTKPSSKIMRTSKMEELSFPLKHPENFEIHADLHKQIADLTDLHWQNGRRLCFKRF